ncbi:WG repeat-containing protein [Paenibacillus gansuensis]|uniref:WG repeat-containing protein n=1 Tax=Paenibacillus gansuensis TaxID=306542 RepID=A0ABW5P991_9BACL
MSEFTSGVLFLRKDIRSISSYVQRITAFNCIVNHLTPKWSVVFIPHTVSIENFCESLSNKVPLLFFWNNEDHGWGYQLFLRGSLNVEFNIEYESTEDHIGKEVDHSAVIAVFKPTKKKSISPQDVMIDGNNVENFKMIMGLEKMSWLNYDKCDEDVLDSNIEIESYENTTLKIVDKEITDLSPFRKNGKYGYINDEGDIVVKPIFDRVDYFSNGLGRVNYKGKNGFINHTGEYVLEPVYNWASSFSDNRCVVDLEESSLVITKAGEVISEIDRKSYKSFWQFSEGKVKVETRDRLIGFMNEHGSWVIMPKYKEAGHFNDGFAWVTLPSGRTVYIDEKEKSLQVPQGYRVGCAFSEGVAIVSQRLSSGAIDTKGTLLLEHLPFTTDFFREGLLAVKYEHQYQYINVHGEVAIEPAFDGAFSFSNGVAMVDIKGRTSFIDKSGRLLYKPQKYYNTIMQSIRENTIFKTGHKDRFMYVSKLTGEPVFYLEELDI